MKYIATLILFAGIYWFFFKEPPQQPAAVYSESSSGLSDAERAYYEKVFEYTMEAVKADQSYAWESYGGKGKITAGKPFISKSKATCRKFKESFTIGGRQGTDQGFGCKREGRGGWCRLKPKDALTCVMEPPGSMLDEGLRGAGDAVESGKGIWDRLWNR
jgi:surface antigen